LNGKFISELGNDERDPTYDGIANLAVLKLP
jgi:hypothetical protein